MQPLVLISLIVFGLIVFGALIVIITWIQKSANVTRLADNELRPQGYWIGIGISIGAGLGVAIGLVLDNLTLGIAIGSGAGVAIGVALEQKNKDKLRPLNEDELKMQKWGVALGILLLLVFAGLFVFLMLLRSR